MNRAASSFEIRERPPKPPSRRPEDVRTMIDDRFRGESVRTLPRANKKYTAGRVCATVGCETKLSMYNKWQYCWQHEPVHSYVPRGKRRSRKEAA
jgi:hypothetical protein